MNHVNTNRITNYKYRYCIKDTKENFNRIGEGIIQRNFYVYCKILYMIDNCQIIEEDSIGITVEICLEEHRELLEDLTRSFYQKINTRRVEEKIRHAYFVGNPFLTRKIYNGFKS